MTTLTSASAATAAPAPADVAHGVRPIPFGRLLRVEWRKSTDTRAARWLLALVALLTAGVVVVPIAVRSIGQTYSGYLGLATTVLTVLLPVVTILATTAEWSQRGAVVTFTQEPRRGRVLAAKASCALLLGLLGAGFAFAVSAAGLAVSGLLGREVVWSLGWRAAAGTIVFVLLNLAMALAFGLLLQNSPAAIVLYYLLPMVWGVLATLSALRGVGEWLNTTQTFGLVQSGEWNGQLPQIATSIGVWILLPLVAGFVRTLRREVT